VFRSVLGCGPRNLHQARNWIPSQGGGYNPIPPAVPLGLSCTVRELCDLINTGAELVDLKSERREKVKSLVVLTLRSRPSDVPDSECHRSNGS
jgi:hypothetical protein